MVACSEVLGKQISFVQIAERSGAAGLSADQYMKMLKK
jgi:hypothetical protein